MEIQET